MTATFDAETALDPRTVVEQCMAFQRSKIILTGVELGVYEALHQAPGTEAELRERLGLDARGARDFLEALVELGILDRTGEVYRNSETAERFLVEDGPAYMGSFLAMANRVMFPAWGKLSDALRTGSPQNHTFAGEDMFGEWYDSPEERRALVRMTEDAVRPVVPLLARGFDWGSVGSVVDLGGCRGFVLSNLVRFHPHLDARVYDLAALEPEFHARQAELGTAGKVRFQGGDFFVGPIPQADVLMLGHCLVDWNPRERQKIISTVFPAVKPGGALLVYDPMLDPGDGSYLPNLIRSLNMQLITRTGACYTVEECAGWMRTAGAAEVSHVVLGHDVTLVIGRRAPA